MDKETIDKIKEMTRLNNLSAEIKKTIELPLPKMDELTDEAKSAIEELMKSLMLVSGPLIAEDREEDFFVLASRDDMSVSYTSKLFLSEIAADGAHMGMFVSHICRSIQDEYSSLDVLKASGLFDEGEAPPTKLDEDMIREIRDSFFQESGNAAASQILHNLIEDGIFLSVARRISSSIGKYIEEMDAEAELAKRSEEEGASFLLN